MLTPLQLRAAMSDAAWAFRGYNATNLGRSHELLAAPAYAPIVEKHLRAASRVASQLLERPMDLVTRVREQQETTLDSYADAIALIVAMELAQLEILEQYFGIRVDQARCSFGYSLGEIAALIASRVISARSALEIPLRLAEDCVTLAHGMTLGVLFSRGPELPLEKVRKLCVRVNYAGRGVIGISSYLSPNSLLLMGQEDTLERFRELMKDELGEKVYLRKNNNQWPPLHTPLVWQKNIPCRAAEMMHMLEGGFTAPRPPILSLVTGKFSYNDYNCREILHRWTDHPQRLWDAVYETLAIGIQTIIHVGPDPNIIPATYQRLGDNILAQTKSSIGMRALSMAAQRPWLKQMLPTRTALLRAPFVKHIILEDWLIDHSEVANSQSPAALTDAGSELWNPTTLPTPAV